MFSGKSEELIRRIKGHHRQAEVRSSNPRWMTATMRPPSPATVRGSTMLSHEGQRRLARHLDPEAQVVALDEVQFMDEGLIPIIEDPPTTACASLRAVWIWIPMATLRHHAHPAGQGEYVSNPGHLHGVEPWGAPSAW
jgi:hypothetical protein